MGLCTPCAGTRPGPADPKRSKAAYPSPRLTEHNERGLSIRINRKSWKKMVSKRSDHRSKLINHQSKIGRTLIKHRSKIIRESSGKRLKVYQNYRWSEKSLALRLGSRLGGVLEASWARLRGQHSPKLASQIEGKSIKKSLQKSIKK